jgi:hypothetical protein
MTFNDFPGNGQPQSGAFLVISKDEVLHHKDHHGHHLDEHETGSPRRRERRGPIAIPFDGRIRDLQRSPWYNISCFMVLLPPQTL